MFLLAMKTISIAPKTKFSILFISFCGISLDLFVTVLV